MHVEPCPSLCKMALCSQKIVRRALKRIVLDNNLVSSSSGIYEVEQLI